MTSSNARFPSKILGRRAAPQRVIRVPAGRFSLLRRAQRWGAWFHFAVGLPDGRVVELQPTGLQILDFHEFSGGQEVSVLCMLERNDNPDAMKRLQAAFAARSRYDAVQWNCETFARYVVEGKGRSVEVGFVVFTTLALAALAST